MNNINTIAKPFVKWAGGKTQLIGEIERRLPNCLVSGDDCVYVEPFVGGGAVLFHLLSKYNNIRKAVINDINQRLITTYRVIKEKPSELIDELRRLQEEYLPKSHDERTEMFMSQRKRFNEGKINDVETASLFIFLNRTCFNGLYRENAKGGFNVPHGRYANPCICDVETIYADSELLQKVEILNGDFSNTLEYAGENIFFYFDPPYKPLSETSSFNTYVKEPFDDNEQIRLRDFVKKVSERGSLFVLSNSDVKGADQNNNFFDDLYSEYVIDRVLATRMVNANPDKRGKLTELMITNVNSKSVEYIKSTCPTIDENFFLSFGKVEYKVPICKIKIDRRRFDYNNPIFEDTVTTIINHFDKSQWFPITVDDEYYLRDGQHRLEVCKRIGIKYIDVQVLNYEVLSCCQYNSEYYKSKI